MLFIRDNETGSNLPANYSDSGRDQLKNIASKVGNILFYRAGLIFDIHKSVKHS